jgi:hypothetical protein
MSKPIEFINPITGKRCFTKHPEKFRDQGKLCIRNISLLDRSNGKLHERQPGAPGFPQVQWERA